MPTFEPISYVQIMFRKNMDNLSQREAYAEKRRLYYDKVYALYTQGMTVREIAKEVPICKSTVQRWVDERIKDEGENLPPGVIIPRTPGTVAKMIKAMNTRIAALENENEALRARVRVLDTIVELLKSDEK